MAALIEVPVAAIERQNQDLTSRAMALTVVNNQQMLEASELVKAVAAQRKEVAATFNPIIERAHAAHKEALAQKAKFDGPLEQAQRRLAGCIGSYQAEQERIRREAQAEAERLQREAEAKERARLKAEEEDRILAAAAQAEDAGDAELAEAIVSAPVVVELPPPAPVIVPRSVPAVQGIVSRETWKAECVDLMALVKAVAAGTVPLRAIMANDVFLGQQARSLKELCRYPGVRVWSESSVAVRS